MKDTSIRIPALMRNSISLDDSTQTLIDTTTLEIMSKFKPVQNEFLDYVHQRTSHSRRRSSTQQQHKADEDDHHDSYNFKDFVVGAAKEQEEDEATFDTSNNDLSLSQLSLAVNDSAVDKKFADVYHMGKVLGEGGFAFVYQCKHKENGHSYAVKEVVKSDYGQKNPNNAQKGNIAKSDNMEIKQEIAALRLVKESPLFVRLLDVFDDEPDNRTWLVMEEMKGGDLLDKLSEIEVYEEWEARKMARTLLEAVAYCHKRHICHRDLKPENILLPKAHDITCIKLADFGCAKLWTKPMEMTTLCGSPQYVAPEVVGLSSSDNTYSGYSCQCDLWSVGVVLYIVLGGYAPFESDDEGELVEMICNGEYEFHEEYWDDVEEAPKALIEQLLEVNPRKRLTARQALNSPWLRRRDKDWVREMDESSSHSSQSTFSAWLERRNTVLQMNSAHSHNSSLHNTSISSSGHGAGGRVGFVIPPVTTNAAAATAVSSSMNGMDSNHSAKTWGSELEDLEPTEEETIPDLTGYGGHDSSTTTGFAGLNLSSE